MKIKNFRSNCCHCFGGVEEDLKIYRLDKYELKIPSKSREGELFPFGGNFNLVSGRFCENRSTHVGDDRYVAPWRFRKTDEL